MVKDNKKNPKKKPKRKRKPIRVIGKLIGFLFLLGFTGALFVGGAVFGYVSSIVKDDPVRSQAEIVEQISHNNMTGFAYFRDGTGIGQLRSEEDRRPISYNEIPTAVIDAVLAIEDNNFYQHIGIDFNGTVRAVKQRVLKENVQTGGSTLTQQLARRVFLSLDRTDNRKLKEMLLAVRIERFMSKPEIITAYMNKVPFGNGSNGYNVYGIKAAAKGIFNITDLKKINIAQAAYLAGLPQLPSAYSAFNGKGEFNETAFNRALKRQKLVLFRMLEENKITQAQYDEALTFDVKASLAPTTQKAYNTFPYLMMETERQGAIILAKLKDPTLDTAALSRSENSQLLEEAAQELKTSGYRIYTTIDKKVYNAMHSVSENPDNFSPYSEKKGLEQVAAMMIDHRTGAILGMIEGRDFYTEQMNYAVQMKRQPGSTMKPIAAYLPALESGIIQPASIIDDSPIILRDYQKGFHIPVNSGNLYKGLITARQALNESRNIPALKLFIEKVGIENAWNFAKKLGITTLEESDYQSQTGVLGGLKHGVTVEELTNAYGAIPNQGEFNDAYMIEKIVDSNGNIVYKHEVKPERVFSEQTAYLMTDMLRTVISESGSTAHSLTDSFKKYGKIPIAGKTGTTQNYADVWFMGYTPDVTLGVWIGYKESVNTLSEDGKKRARSIWAKVMNEVTDRQPDLFKTDSFVKPEGIVKMTVSGYSGKKPTALTEQAGRLVTDIFNVKYVPTEDDDVLIRAKYVTYNSVNYIPQESTPSDMVSEKVVVRREKPIKQLIEELNNAFDKMKGGHKDISFYLPRDAGEDAPTKVDPRVDDGHNPSQPQNVSVSSGTGNVTISFSKNPESDIVGYRLYKSTDSVFFSYSKALLVGNGTSFSDYAESGRNTSFYVTAVDVAGRESEKSATVTINDWGSIFDGLFPTSNGDENQQNDGVPKAPNQLRAHVNGSSVSLDWRERRKDNVTKYTVYQSNAADGAYSIIGTSASNEYQFTPDSKSGWIRIIASNDNGDSEFSNAVSYNLE